MLAGFTNSGRRNVPTSEVGFGAARHCSSSNQTCGVIGTSSARKARFIATLSIPTADARIPQPTYGTPSVSSSPWTTPSSPNGPCSSGNTTSSTASTVSGSPTGETTTSPRRVPRRSSTSGPTTSRWSSIARAVAGLVPQRDQHVLGHQPEAAVPGDPDRGGQVAVPGERPDHTERGGAGHLVLGRRSAKQDADPGPGVCGGGAGHEAVPSEMVDVVACWAMSWAIRAGSTLPPVSTTPMVDCGRSAGELERAGQAGGGGGFDEQLGVEQREAERVGDGVVVDPHHAGQRVPRDRERQPADQRGPQPVGQRGGRRHGDPAAGGEALGERVAAHRFDAVDRDVPAPGRQASARPPRLPRRRGRPGRPAGCPADRPPRSARRWHCPDRPPHRGGRRRRGPRRRWPPAVPRPRPAARRAWCRPARPARRTPRPW